MTDIQLQLTPEAREALQQAIQTAAQQIKDFFRQLAEAIAAWWQRIQPHLRQLRRLQYRNLRRPAPWLKRPTRNHARLYRRSSRR